MAEEAKILQVIPADGWSAQYEEEDGIPLVCFALVQDIDEAGAMTSAIRPMACVGGTIEFCDEYDNYTGVARNDESYEDGDD